MLSVGYVSFMLSVTCKPYMLSVVMLDVVMLSVVALCLSMPYYCTLSKTAQLKVENSAQTAFKFCSIKFCSPCVYHFDCYIRLKEN